MNVTTFAASLTSSVPPSGLSDPARAVWHGLKGEWEVAHEIVQAHEGEPSADWIHAWLHRVEGDTSNAGYWYRRAGRQAGNGDLMAEGRAIAAFLLEEG